MTKGLHKDFGSQLEDRLAAFERVNGDLPGIRLTSRRETLIAQMISSLRRIEYVKEMQNRAVCAQRIDPHSSLFDPIKGASYLGRRGELDEAVWMTFIGTHFGKHRSDAWRLAANVMGSFGGGPVWTAEQFGRDKSAFLLMLQTHEVLLRDFRLSGRYSNHRQYQSKQPSHIYSTFDTFHDWLRSWGDFRGLLQHVHTSCGQEPTVGFDVLYKLLDSVAGFGRLGKFDFLTMLSKIGLAPIEAGSVYLIGATGPFAGARLLFRNDRDYPITARALQPKVDSLDAFLLVGKQVIEDSLCNWQKSPDSYEYFRG